MLLESHKYSLYKPINYLGPSYKCYSLYPTYYPTWVFHKNTYHLTTKLGHKIILSQQKKPKIIYFVGKIQKAQQSPLKSSLLLGTSKSPLLYGTFKARCYTAPLKSPLPHGNIFTKSYKTQMLFWHLFYKTQYYFGTYFTKSKCYFGTYFTKPNIILAPNLQNSNAILVPILQSPILLWHLFTKAQTLFWQKQLHYTQRPKTISW